MLIDLKPLFKYRDFRLLYLGQLISGFGSMLTYVALPYQIFHLTHSSLAVGNIGIVQLIPLLVTSLWGGVLADKLDRRKLLLCAELGLLLMMIILFLNALYEPRVWVIYLIAALASACNGFHRPTLEAMTQNLVNRDDMTAVSALQSFKFASTMIAGPSIAGLLLAKYDVAVVFGFDICTYFVALTAIYAIQTKFKTTETNTSVVASIKESVKYAFSRQELVGTYAIDFAAMIFGMPMALFPAIALTYQDPHAIGWLYAAPSLGMFLTSIFSGWANKITRHGKAIAIAATTWGLAIVAFGFMHNLILALFFLAIAGAADEVSAIFRITVWNQTIPTQIRGRMAGIEMISYMSGPLLGNAEAGLVAAATNTQVSVISGGLLCVICVIILSFLLPKFWRYQAA